MHTGAHALGPCQRGGVDMSGRDEQGSADGGGGDVINIRDAIVAPPGRVLISADYSQVCKWVVRGAAMLHAVVLSMWDCNVLIPILTPTLTSVTCDHLHSRVLHVSGMCNNECIWCLLRHKG